MDINSLISHLKASDTISFKLPDGTLVPSHFHVTEVGKVSKDFIDCGGKRRQEQVASLQLWEADDYDHRLHPEKLVHIVELSQRILEMGNLKVEVEYQGPTIGKYDLEFDGNTFLLMSKQTDCLARDNCGVPENKTKIDLSSMTANANACTPGGGCC